MRNEQWVSDDPRSACLRELSARLVGPRRARRSLLTEAADHLTDAADAYRRVGLAPDAAARRAVADFGTPDQVAPGFQSTLAVAAARRTAWLLMVILCVQPFLWDRGLMLGVDEGRRAPDNSVFSLLDHAVEYGGTVTVVGAALCLLLTGIGNRWRIGGPAVARLTGWFALGTCVVVPLLASSMVLMVGPGESGARVAWLVALLLLPLALAGWSGRLCLAAAR